MKTEVKNIYKNIFNKITHINPNLSLNNYTKLPFSGFVFAIINDFIQSKKSQLIILPTEEHAKLFFIEVHQWLIWNNNQISFSNKNQALNESNICYFGETITTAYTSSHVPDENLLRNINTLKNLYNHQKSIYIASYSAINRKVLLKDQFEQHCLNLWVKKNITYKDNQNSNQSNFQKDKIENWLESQKYKKADKILKKGHYVLKENIIDLFNIVDLNPVRLRFENNILTQISVFNLQSQLSIHDLEEISLYSYQLMSNAFINDYNDKKEQNKDNFVHYQYTNFLDYVNSSTEICFYNVDLMEQKWIQKEKEYEYNYQLTSNQKISKSKLKPTAIFAKNDISNISKKYRIRIIEPFFTNLKKKINPILNSGKKINPCLN